MAVLFNNPGNIRAGQDYAGELDDFYTAADGSKYVKFNSKEMGLRALFVDLRSKINEFDGDISKIITKYAPPSDNNPTDKYIDYVKSKVGSDIANVKDLPKLVSAVINFENKPDVARQYTSKDLLNTAFKLSSVDMPKATTLDEAKNIVGLTTQNATTTETQEVKNKSDDIDITAKPNEKLPSILEERREAEIKKQRDEELNILEKRTAQSSSKINDPIPQIIENRDTVIQKKIQQDNLNIIDRVDQQKAASQENDDLNIITSRTEQNQTPDKQQEGSSYIQKYIRPSGRVPVGDPEFRAFSIAEAERQQEEEAVDLGEFVSATIEEDWLHSYIFAGKEEFEPDMDLMRNGLTQDQFTDLTTDVPEEYHDYLEDIVSLPHAQELKKQILRRVENEKKMQSWGWQGDALRIGLNIADPFAAFATIATEGVAAPLIWGQKASRIGRIVRGAAAGMASSAAIEGYIATQSQTRDAYDVLYSTAAAGLFGGAIGSFNFGKKIDPNDPVVKAHQNHLAAVEDAQAQDIANDVRKKLVGDDASVGAAENPLSPSPLMKPLRNGVDLDADDIEMQERMFDKVLGVTTHIDMTGYLLASKNPFFNRLGQILGEDAVGARNGGTVNIQSTADILKTNIMKGQFAEFYADYNIQYKDWVKSTKTGLFRKHRLSNRREFGELVADAIENPNGEFHPAVKNMAKTNARLYAQLLDEAKANGVKGFENIPKNLTYFTHRWNKFKFQEMRQVHGDKAVKRLLSQGLVRGTPDLSEDAADKLAEAMYSKIRSDTAGLDSGFSRLFTAESRETLKDIMLEEKFGKIDAKSGQFKEFSEADVDSLLNLFKQKDTGLPSYAKGRLKFDMNTEIEWGNTTLSLKSLQERDAEQVFTMYGNEMAGRIALAKKGIKSETDFVKEINKGRAYAENEGISEDVFNKEAEVSQIMYNMIIGRRPNPQYDPNSTPMKIVRLVQDYNFLRLMGQVGWAQFAELGNAYNVNGFRAMLRAVPEYKRMLKRAADGKLEDPVLRDIEAFYGTGSDRMIQQMINRLEYIEPTGQYDRRSLLNRAQVRTDQLKRLQADVSGMAPITLMLERGTARVVAQTIADLAFDNASLTIKRLNSLGLGKQIVDGEEIDFGKIVFDAIKEHATLENSSIFKAKKLRELNLENWPSEAREAFGVALARWTRRTIQQNDVGNLSRFMTKPWGQVISQFRTFQIVSHSKQLLHNLSMNDTRAYLAMAFSSMTAGAAYFAQQNVKMIGMSDRERRKYKEKNLGKDFDEIMINVAKAGFSRSSWSAFIPSTVDTAAFFFADDPIFSYRTTGLGQDFLGGIPAVQAFNRGVTAVSGGTRVLSPFSDQEATEGKARAIGSLLPFQNVTGIGNVHRYIAEQFPDK